MNLLYKLELLSPIIKSKNRANLKSFVKIVFMNFMKSRLARLDGLLLISGDEIKVVGGDNGDGDGDDDDDGGVSVSTRAAPQLQHHLTRTN